MSCNRWFLQKRFQRCATSFFELPSSNANTEVKLTSSNSDLREVVRPASKTRGVVFTCPNQETFGIGPPELPGKPEWRPDDEINLIFAEECVGLLTSARDSVIGQGQRGSNMRTHLLLAAFLKHRGPYLGT